MIAPKDQGHGGEHWSDARSIACGLNAMAMPCTPTCPECLRLMATRGVDTFLLVAVHDPASITSTSIRQAHAGAGGGRQLTAARTSRAPTTRSPRVWAQQHVRTTIREHLAQSGT